MLDVTRRPPHRRLETDPPDEDLIAAWHSEDGGAALAMGLGITTDRLYICWHRLKAEGLVPNRRRRLGGAVQPRRDRSNYSRLPPHDPKDDLPIDYYAKLERITDKFLALLRAAHGDDNRTGVRA